MFVTVVDNWVEVPVVPNDLYLTLLALAAVHVLEPSSDAADLTAFVPPSVYSVVKSTAAEELSLAITRLTPATANNPAPTPATVS